jgi:membrane protease YdiL (CAAX protease family)
MDSDEHIDPLDTIRLVMGIFIGLILTWGIVSLAFPHEIKKTAEEMNPIMFLLNTFTFQVIILTVVGVFFKLNNLSLVKVFGFKNSSVGLVLLCGVLGYIVFLPLGLQLQKIVIILIKTFIGDAIPVESQMVVKILQREIPTGYKILIGISTVILAPISEEILFRGLLYNAVKNAGYPLVALYGVSLFFGVIHNNAIAMLPLAFFGVILTVVYEITGNLLATIITHSLFNLTNYCILMLNLNWEMILNK